MIYLNQTPPVELVLDSVTGKYHYLVSLGNVIFNDTIFNYESVAIHIFEEELFLLPFELDKYAAINVYLNPVTGKIIYDKVLVFEKTQDSVTAKCLFGVIPLAQFIVKQVSESFEVVSVNAYSRMSTFAVTTNAETGVQGIPGMRGHTGPDGKKGVQGIEGVTGIHGITGIKGLTGRSFPGPVGVRGEPGFIE